MTRILLSDQEEVASMETLEQITPSMSSSRGDPKSQARKPASRAVALGQVFTGPELSKRLIAGLGIRESASNRLLLDPCVGPGTFLRHLRDLSQRKIEVHAYDVDPAMVELTKSDTSDKAFKLKLTCADYLTTESTTRYDFAILNPPYVRQEWIEHKVSYRERFHQRFGLLVPGTSNLYVYFLVKVIEELKPHGRFACIVYDSWRSTQFGQWLNDYLHTRCDKVRIEAAPGTPFEGRLIDATLVFGEKRTQQEYATNKVICEPVPQYTDTIEGFTSIAELFHTKRGLRLKQADFFLTAIDQAQKQGAIPFVKKVQSISGYSVPDDHHEAALLVTKGSKATKTIETLGKRLTLALANPGKNIPILTWYRERPADWMLHGNPPRAPIIFNYFLRRRPKHIFNSQRCYSDNFYGLTPTNDIPVLAWVAALNSTAAVLGIMEQARNQGAGLAKLQLFEYRRVRVPDLRLWTARDVAAMEALGNELISYSSTPQVVLTKIDRLIASTIGNPVLSNAELPILVEEMDRRARRPKE